MLGNLHKVLSLVSPLLHPNKNFLFFVSEGTVRGYRCLTCVSKSATRRPRCDFGPLRLLTEKPVHSGVESSLRV